MSSVVDLGSANGPTINVMATAGAWTAAMKTTAVSQRLTV